MAKKRKIIIVGESHSHAPQEALRRGLDLPDDVELIVHRLTKVKNGQLIGSIAYEDVLLLCSTLDKDDLIVSMIGGNQHAALSLIQHPRPFDVATATGTIPEQPDGKAVQLVPRNALRAIFEQNFQSNDGKRILAIADAGPQRTVHLMAPPPKDNEAHILKKVETDFAAKGIMEKGVSPAPLRQRMWGIQNEALKVVLSKSSVDLLPPPDKTMQPDGFLKPEYYASDATHANMKYGAEVIQQVLKVATSSNVTNG